MKLLYLFLILSFSALADRPHHAWKIDALYEPFFYTHEQSGAVGDGKGTLLIPNSVRFNMHYRFNKSLRLEIGSRLHTLAIDVNEKTYEESYFNLNSTLYWKNFFLQLDQNSAPIVVTSQETGSINSQSFTTYWLGAGYRNAVADLHLRYGGFIALPVKMELEQETLESSSGYKVGIWLDYFRRFEMLGSKSWSWYGRGFLNSFHRSFEMKSSPGESELNTRELGIGMGITRLF